MNFKDQFIPHLIVSDGKAALKFYTDVFAASVGEMMLAPDSKCVAHGEILLDGHKLFVSDEFTEQEGGSCKMPQTLGGTCVRINLQTTNADAVMERALAAGARVIMKVQDMFWGARYGKFIDPFGHEWGINQQVRELTPEEADVAAQEFMESRKTKD